MSSRETIGGGSLGAVVEDGMNGGGDGAYPGPNLGPFGGDCEDELKKLLFVNLDLIQHQEELLVANNRTILALRRENEMLKCRLDRIERRMSLVYHKGLNMTATAASAQSSVSPCQHPDARPTRSSSRRKLNLETTDAGSELTEKAKDLPRKSESEVDSKGKSEEACSEAAFLKGQLSRTSLRRSAGKTTSGRCKTGRRSEPLLTASDAEVPLKQQRLDDVIAGDRTEVRQERLRRRIRRNSALLMTETLYYVPPLPSAVDIEDEEDVEVSCQEEILVPSWRLRHLSTLYVMEGTENLDDRVFLKRHQKFETEEKRRKRWDIQRLKDLQLLRKRQMKEEASQAKAQDIVTFLPRTDRALYIEVNDMVPVSAFGYPLPALQTVEFHLPWYNASKDSVAKNKRFRKT